MDNAFIIEILKHNPQFSKKRRFLEGCIRLFNAHSEYFELRLERNMINIEQAMNLYHLLSQVIILDVSGDVVELGCYNGLTSILLQKTLDQYGSKKRLHVYDSFCGLPEKEKQDKDSLFKTGSLKTTKDSLIQNFEYFNVRLPEIHEGWFEDTLHEKLPEKVCFAHIDADFYSSTLEGLSHVYPRLSKNAIVVIDDYCDLKIFKSRDKFPGVKAACDEFFADKNEKITVLICGKFSHGYFRKL